MNKRIISGILVFAMMFSLVFGFAASPVSQVSMASMDNRVSLQRTSLKEPIYTATGDAFYEIPITVYATGVPRNKSDPVTLSLSAIQRWLKVMYNVNISDINWNAVNLTYNGNYIPVQVDDMDLDGVLGTEGDELVFLIPEDYDTSIDLTIKLTNSTTATAAITTSVIDLTWDPEAQDFYVYLGNFSTGNPITFNITIDHAFPKATGWSAGSIYAASTPNGSDPINQTDWARSWQLRMYWNHTGGDDWIFSGAQDLNYTLLWYKVGPVRAVIVANYSYTDADDAMNTTRIFKLYANQSLVEIEDRYYPLNPNSEGDIVVKMGTSYGIMDKIEQPGYGTRDTTDTTWATTDPSAGNYTWAALYDSDSEIKPGFGFVTSPDMLLAVQGGQGYNDIVEFNLLPQPRHVAVGTESKSVVYITAFDASVNHTALLQSMYEKLSKTVSLGGTAEDIVAPDIKLTGPYSTFIWRGVDQGTGNPIEFSKRTYVALVGQVVNLTVVTVDKQSGIKNVTIHYEVYNTTDALNKTYTTTLTEANSTDTYDVLVGDYPEGYYVNYTVTVYDLFGNKAEANGTFTYIVDNTPPTLYLTDISVGSWNDFKSCLLLSGNDTNAMYYTEENWMNIFVNDTVEYDSKVAPGSGIARVTLYWKVDDTVSHVDMYTNDWGFSHNRYFAPIKGPFPYGSVVEFWFETEDFAGLTTTSKHFYLVIKGDDRAPELGTLTYTPTAPEPDTPVNVSITVTDPDTPNSSGIKRVYINYTIDGGETWHQVDMTKTTGDTYEGTIPGVSANTKVIFEVVAEDNAGQVSSTRAYYVVLAPKAEGIPLDYYGLGAIGVAVVIAIALVFLTKKK
ncbi:MAG: fibronectin type III domain-containing protein [Candidatus Odinarchaeota archaeon]|nr:fibronectin type III domain-containing protein [Candidatus Odinarchaeota archaeon]